MIVKADGSMGFFWNGTRKPDRSTFKYQKAILDGKQEEIACFDTLPFSDVKEYTKYRDIAKNFTRLVTKEEWDRFYELLKEDPCK